jgi:hypothetical protein
LHIIIYSTIKGFLQQIGKVCNKHLRLAAYLGSLFYSPSHKVRIYKEYHSVYSLVGIGTLPPPSLASECIPPLGTRGGGEGHTRLRVRGWGSPSSDDLRKSFALLVQALDYGRRPSIPYPHFKQDQVNNLRQTPCLAANPANV